MTLLLQGQDLAKGYLAAKTPSLPHLSRFYRVLQKAPELLAHLAVRLSGGQGLLQVVDLQPIPLAHGHRIHGLSLPEAAVGVGSLLLPSKPRGGREDYPPSKDGLLGGKGLGLMVKSA